MKKEMDTTVSPVNYYNFMRPCIIKKLDLSKSPDDPDEIVVGTFQCLVGWIVYIEEKDTGKIVKGQFSNLRFTGPPVEQDR